MSTGEKAPKGSADLGKAMDETKKDAVPVASLKDPKVRAQAKDADIIFGFDTTSGGRSLFYGKDTLARISQGGAAEQMGVMGFLYDSKTDQLEYLIAAVQVIKGSCCYGKD